MGLKLHQPHDTKGQATEAPDRLLSKKRKKEKKKAEGLATCWET